MRHVQLLLVLLVCAVLTPQLAAAQDSGLSLFVMGGSQTKPTNFDVKRQVEYGSGYHFGGGMLLQLYRNVAVRADAAFAHSAGDENDSFQEPVTLNRVYGSGGLQLVLPLSSGIAPYVYGGGGVVNLRRDAPSYKFDLTEGAGIVAAGVQYRVKNSRLTAFGQIAEWIYSRTSVGGTQKDAVFSVGVSYSLIGASQGGER